MGSLGNSNPKVSSMYICLQGLEVLRSTFFVCPRYVRGFHVWVYQKALCAHLGSYAFVVPASRLEFQVYLLGLGALAETCRPTIPAAGQQTDFKNMKSRFNMLICF